MARRSEKVRGRKKSRKARGSGGGKVRVKGHTRSPRGPDKGKKSVYVKGYRRRVPK